LRTVCQSVNCHNVFLYFRKSDKSNIGLFLLMEYLILWFVAMPLSCGFVLFSLEISKAH